jgi:hypothetical protein
MNGKTLPGSEKGGTLPFSEPGITKEERRASGK